MDVVKRAHPGSPRALAMEAAGLAWLAEAEGVGGTRIARARLEGSALHVVRVEEAPATPARAEALGRSLAALHASGAPWHCSPPPAATAPFEVGSSRTLLAAAPVGDGWGAAWAEVSVRPILERCAARGRLDADDARIVARAVDRMAAGGSTRRSPRACRRSRASTGTCGAATCCGATSTPAPCSSTRTRRAGTPRPTSRCSRSSGCRGWTRCSPPTTRPRRSRTAGGSASRCSSCSRCWCTRCCSAAPTRRGRSRSRARSG